MDSPTPSRSSASLPAVSVVLPVYNAARYLAAALTSVLRQTFQDFEIIAVDDGSSDDSKKILDRFAASEPRLQVISRPNTGIVGALNDGLAVARAEFIARMDGDDIALPTRFQAQLDYLRAHPDCVGLGTAVQIIDSQGAVVDRYRPPADHEGILKELLQGNGGALIHPTAFFRASALRAVNRYDPAFCKVEDLDLYLRLSREGRLANLPMLGLQYRHHVQSTNFIHREKQRPLMHTILQREHQARGLTYRPVEQTGHTGLPASRLHAQWAYSALTHGKRSTAIRHALSSAWSAPTDSEGWRALKYALSARRPIAS
jgi:glycosyltransferase involved in cell wall biosynthesis